MAILDEKKEFAAYIVDLLQQMGPVYSKRMFGGFGVFLDGLMFGLIADNVLYLKVDAQNKADFLELGLLPFTYDKQGKAMNLSYFQIPEECMDNSDAMIAWGNKGFGAALRAAALKAKKTAKKPKSD